VENLGEPLTVVSNLLAGDLSAADVAARRFVINTFMGYAGVVDVADEHYGYAREPADLRRPLCRYGVPPGPLIVVPFFGETHLRDLVGLYGTKLVLYEVLGTGYIPYTASTATVSFLDVEATSLDPDPEEDGISPSSSYENMRARVFANADSKC
jgi:phospholipid-binding lipoprotein MlaA